MHVSLVGSNWIGNIEEKEKWNKNERHSIELENEVYKSEGLNIKRDEEYIK